ncbi:MAG: hypothetical protein DRI56_01140 [Chloroflexota bacterium]|nr:MAG: hypothetical protein DRI56_01140 [Chloroflexota bacterium]
MQQRTKSHFSARDSKHAHSGDNPAPRLHPGLDAGYYMALGYQGQFIYIVPEKNMVVVFTSKLRDNDFFIPEMLLNEYIIPAAK